MMDTSGNISLNARPFLFEVPFWVYFIDYLFQLITECAFILTFCFSHFPGSSRNPKDLSPSACSNKVKSSVFRNLLDKFPLVYFSNYIITIISCTKRI